MPLFIKWLLLILITAFAVSVFFWFRLRKASRFQGRLTLFFFLFVIIPFIPLSLFIGQLLMTSTETFILPQVEHSLTQSLDTFRDQLNERGLLFLNMVSDPVEISTKALQAAQMAYAGIVTFSDSTALLSRFVSQTNTPEGPADLAALTHDQLLALTATGKFYTSEGRHYFESWRKIKDDFVFVGFLVPDYVAAAKEQVSTTLSNYTTLALLGETMLQGNIVWIVVLLFVLFTAIVSSLLARTVSAGVSGPIRKLTEGMRRIGGGDLSYRVHVKAKDEVSYLVDSFNQMAEELKTSREKLQRAERAAAWRDIARQVSHEIKNPLTPIEFSIYRLESTLPVELSGNENLKEPLRMIKEEIASIRRIANTFSQFAKMPHSELVPTDVSALLDESVKLYQNQASHIKMIYERESNLPKVPADAQQLRGVFHNLIKNAIEASDKDGKILVRIQAEKHSIYHLKIIISDNGCGMDEDTVRRIFDPYFTTKTEGSGIGLFLAQRIIADHHGDIDVHSTPGEGTTFTIRI